MRHLFENEYIDLAKSDRNSSDMKANQPNRTTTRSKLDDDFEEDDDSDEFEIYISEKPAKKETNVLDWWKVSYNFILNSNGIWTE